MWRIGRYNELWDDAMALEAPRSSEGSTEEYPKAYNIRRTITLAQGAYRKVTQATQSAGIHPPSTEAANALAEKHPQDTLSDDVEYTLPADMPAPLHKYPMSMFETLLSISHSGRLHVVQDCDHERLQSALEFLRSDKMRSDGFHLNLTECELWWPAEPPQDVKASCPVDFTQVHIEGTLVLNAPVGSTQFCERKFTEKVRSLDPVLDDVSALENTHVSFTLLKFCLGVCKRWNHNPKVKVNYQWRVTPPESTITGAKLFDRLIEKCLRRILGCTLDTAVFKELQLPVTTPSDYPHLGIGPTSATDRAAAAFFPSSAACDMLVSMALTGSILQALRGYAFAKLAHAAWASQCEEGAALLFEAFEVDRPSQQKT